VIRTPAEENQDATCAFPPQAAGYAFDRAFEKRGRVPRAAAISCLAPGQRIALGHGRCAISDKRRLDQPVFGIGGEASQGFEIGVVLVDGGGGPLFDGFEPFQKAGDVIVVEIDELQIAPEVIANAVERSAVLGHASLAEQPRIRCRRYLSSNRSRTVVALNMLDAPAAVFITLAGAALGFA
jgi:hypothetical protein